MKKLLFILLILGCQLLNVSTISAQPKARRQAQQEAKSKTNATNITPRAQISYPTASAMSDDVVWRRDIYRELDLNQPENSGLYYPVEPVGSQMNLFTYLFKLMLTGSVPAYEYRLDGNEVFNDSSRIKPLALLDNYHIYYERVNGRLRLENSDIPSREVKSYYIKESSYFDQANSQFHTKVIAICPIMSREDDFGDGAAKYPLFWMKYEDVEPFLTKQTIMTSDLNNAATMTAEDYFNQNCYKGKIYKTNNMLGKTLAQYCPTDSAMAKEQNRIEAEILAFEKTVYGDKAKRDSLDSIAKAKELEKLGAKALKKKNRRSGSTQKTTASKRRSSSRGSSAGGSAARVSVRRERH